MSKNIGFSGDIIGLMADAIDAETKADELAKLSKDSGDESGMEEVEDEEVEDEEVEENNN